ncbi:hypothetical protein MAR_002698 [Mya arenaria]|uniref:Uncharacterized protein n=1 Tax=Mya arenaria TaxID=6604 RepID=A0ABY7G4P7_MYAAR|nr:hypothetical protein MAR_002698 [Mya arenaria]
MELKGFRRSTVTSLLSIAIAVILCVVGTFSNSWWTILKSFASMVQILVLASVYGKISTAMASALTLPSDLLYYQTLPVGICAISGISCIPAAVGMLYWRLVTTGTVRKAAVVV